ncbi:MAG: DNA polymerase IV, partial [Nitrospinaceae bacterium]
MHKEPQGVKLPPLVEGRRREILHIDMDAFFVSVERVLDPSLAGRAVIVGGDPDGRWVVAAASYEARDYGVHSAMPIARARRLCPHAVFRRGSHRRYSEFSARLFTILETYSPLVEPMSLDEACLDLTGCARLHRGPAAKTAVRIRGEVQRTLGLPASIGLASNKLMAKIASGLAKPQGFLRVQAGQEGGFLAPLPIGRIPGIGPKSRERFQRLGIRTVGQLAALPRELLEEVYGNWGARLYWRARGVCDAPVRRRGESKSISRETTLDEDTLSGPFLESVLSRLTEQAAAQLRADGLHARCVTLKLRYSDFRTLTRSHTLSQPAWEDHILYSAAAGLFRRTFGGRTR